MAWQPIVHRPLNGKAEGFNVKPLNLNKDVERNVEMVYIIILVLHVVQEDTS